jgi:hypothetical protein
MNLQSIGEVEVLGIDGERVRLSSLWMERALVLVFVRHFG